MVPYPPTYHPGVYERPEKEPFLDIGGLFKLLFKPKEAFEDLYDHTSSSQGIILAVTFTLLSAVLNIMMMFAIMGNLDIPDNAGTIPGSGGSATQQVVNVILGIALFFLSAYIVFNLLKEKGRRPSMDKTIGLMGYAMFPMFIIGVLLAIYTPFYIDSLEGIDTEDPDDVGNALGAICGGTAILLGLSLVGFVWAIVTHAHAQSVANDVSKGTAAGYVLLTWLIVGLISFAVSAVVALIIVGSAF